MFIYPPNSSIEFTKGDISEFKVTRPLTAGRMDDGVIFTCLQLIEVHVWAEAESRTLFLSYVRI
jgi:hypothetical protein